MERELKLILSLEMAKKWYKSDDKTLQTLALNVYTKEKLNELTLDEILYEIDEIRYNERINQSNAYLNISIIADYFNNYWRKEDNVIGYFWSYNNNTDKWEVREHNTVTYTGIIYYRTKEIAFKAFKLAKPFYQTLK